jgi:hypothetical protein
MDLAIRAAVGLAVIGQHGFGLGDATLIVCPLSSRRAILRVATEERMLEGHCNCGAVGFAIDHAVRDIYMCHCSICRRWTGHTGVAVVVVPKSGFRWTRGEDHVAHWTKPDADWQSWFCRQCGSALPGPNDARNMFVPAGLLPDHPDLQVAHHIWVDSKAAWDSVCDAGRRHPGAFGTA